MRSRPGWAFGSSISSSPRNPDLSLTAMNSETPQQDSPAQATAPSKTKASSQPAGSKRAKRPKQQQQQAGAGGSSGGGGAAGQQKLKIVVRRLPPNIPEDIFWTSTEQWVNDETAGWRSFRKGKVAKSSVLSFSSTSRPGLYRRLTALSFGSRLQGEQGVAFHLLLAAPAPIPLRLFLSVVQTAQDDRVGPRARREARQPRRALERALGPEQDVLQDDQEAEQLLRVRPTTCHSRGRSLRRVRPSTGRELVGLTTLLFLPLVGCFGSSTESAKRRHQISLRLSSTPSLGLRPGLSTLPSHAQRSFSQKITVHSFSPDT